jgi:hypothetical protein
MLVRMGLAGRALGRERSAWHPGEIEDGAVTRQAWPAVRLFLRLAADLGADCLLFFEHDSKNGRKKQ